MNMAKKALLVGATLSVVSFIATAPAAHAIDISAVQPTHKELLKKEKNIALAANSNDVVNVSTELNCTNHMLTATVTNKTSGDVTPTVTLNGQEPTYPVTWPIEPGKKATYFWSFSGNNLLADVKVGVDTYKDVSVSPMINCSEPVSFDVTATSKSMVSGRLTNNSSFVSQTVYTRINGGDIRVENLEPGESRLIALPFNAQVPDPQSAFVTIGTDDGFEGTYTVELTAPIISPIPLLK